MKKRLTVKKEQGQILIFTFVFMLVLTIIVGALVSYAAVQIKSHRQAVNRESGLDIAEAGAELAIWKMNNVANYNGEANTPYANGVYSVTITGINNSTKLIKVDSYIPDAVNPIAHRTIQITSGIGTKNVGFNYGAQVDTGGVVLDNNAAIIGNVYSNGNITGGNATITGDTFVSGATGLLDSIHVSGNATAHTIDSTLIGKNASGYALTHTTVNGNASFHSIAGNNCLIKGNAIYDSRNNCTVNGSSTTPNPAVPADPAYLPLPIDAATITQWEVEAASGGTSNGDMTINASQSLGPKKIVGNLNVGNNVTLTITGTVWVTGNIVFSNNDIVQLDSSYGTLSGLMIAGTNGNAVNGRITPTNNTQINGSGTAGSYLMMLSEKSGVASPAIDVNNNAAGAIFYAGSGLVDIANNAGAKEITGFKLHLNNNATITYDSGLTNSNFSSGGGAGWQISDQTYQLLR